MIVFVACGAKKRDVTCRAEDMYLGYYFRMNLIYAKKLCPAKIYILSAKYGVLELDDIIAPYNRNLNACRKQERKEWAYICYQQLKSKNVNFDETAIFLGGQAYWQYLSKVFSNKEVPFAHKKMGNKLR